MTLDRATAKKLRLQPGQRAAILNAPDGYWDEDAAPAVQMTTRSSGQCDFVQLFARTKADLDRLAPRALKC